MIVFDLSCDAGHRFEGWFRSSSAFEDQGAKGLLACPQCGSADVAKAPMAPAVPAKGNAARATVAEADDSRDEVASQGGAIPPALREAMQKLAQIQADTIKDSTYVGDRFAEESRAMHYGEKDAALIHGKADARQARELLEEGIALAPLLIPFTPPEETN
ncbi:DUF1178 family protein [Alteriqipengyuania sp. 357]